MIKRLILLCLIPAMLVSCKSAPVDQSGPVMTVTEQEEKAMERFKTLLDETRELDRSDAMPLILEGYREVMDKYPDSFLAEESYFRMMTIALHEVYPPKEEEAENLYNEYFRRYKHPQMGMAMNGELARYYYKEMKWEKLAKFTTPFMREYVKSGKYGDTVFLFLYTEAKFHLKDYDEARKGYQIIKRNSAGTRDADIAEQRLEYIRSIQGK